MGRRSAAATAHYVNEAAFGELPDEPGHLLRALLVFAKLVGEAAVGVGGDKAVHPRCSLGNMGPQLRGAEGAVETDGEGPGMAHGVAEGGHGLAGQGAAAGIGDGAGDD